MTNIWFYLCLVFDHFAIFGLSRDSLIIFSFNFNDKILKEPGEDIQGNKFDLQEYTKFYDLKYFRFLGKNFGGRLVDRTILLIQIG